MPTPLAGSKKILDVLYVQPEGYFQLFLKRFHTSKVYIISQILHSNSPENWHNFHLLRRHSIISCCFSSLQKLAKFNDLWSFVWVIPAIFVPCVYKWNEVQDPLLQAWDFFDAAIAKKSIYHRLPILEFELMYWKQRRNQLEDGANIYIYIFLLPRKSWTCRLYVSPESQ